MKASTNTLYFRGTDDELELVKQLSRGAPGNPYGPGIRRLAPVFAGDFEPCAQVVLLPGVITGDADRITAVYGEHGVPVLRFQPNDPDRPAEPKTEPLPAPEPAPAAAAEAKDLSNANLRRMPNRALRDLASGRGIDITDAQDRASLIAAIEAGAKGQTP